MDTPTPGLTQVEAARRLQLEGPNEPTPPVPRTPWRITLEVAREPMFQLLLAAGLLYLVLGDTGEALVLLAFVTLTVAITVVQERRTEKALDALRDLSSPRALVQRDGAEVRIAGRDVVRGDLLLLREGDRVPADARVLWANDLKADESLLTGEAVAVGKQAGAADAAVARPGGEGGGFVYGGTLLVAGQGRAEVVATGASSEMGRIGAALGAIEVAPTPLALQTRRLVRWFSVAGLGLSAVVVLLWGLQRGDWLGGLLAGITLAMSLLPQEFLLILSVFMAMGAWRMSRQRVLVRRAATLETLGSATVLCTDKTGTLTRNRMAVAELVVPGGPAWTGAEGPLPPALEEVLRYGVLASEREPFDPMDKAFIALAAARCGPAPLHADWTLVQDHGLSPALRAMTHVWRTSDAAAAHVVAVKGAPEAVAGLCRLDAAQAQAVSAAAHALAERGLRVLAVAGGEFEGGTLPDTPQGYTLRFIGLAALADPLRDGVPAAVQQCRSAGIRVVMITGDHPSTALAIAAQAGLDTAGGAVTGGDIEAMDEATLRQRAASATVFARVLPEQKLRIVQALKAQGQVVAMTGDGVNDAPSLKAAHIGIAMGGRGTDVAREAASLVLLDDDFGSLVQAVRLGRRIYDNLRKAMGFVFSVHVPIAGLTLLPLMFGLPVVFTPVHIAFLELVIDPVCSIVFEAEPEEDDVMTRPPRDPAAPLFSAALIGSSLLQGVFVLAAVAAWFVGLLHAGLPDAQARAATFLALVACSVALIIVNRAFGGHLVAALRRPNPSLWRMVAVTAALLAAVLAVPALRTLFRFEWPGAATAVGAVGLAVGVLLVLEAAQRLQRHFTAPHGRNAAATSVR